MANVSGDPGVDWDCDGVALQGDRPEDESRVLTPCVFAIEGGGFRLLYMGHGPASPPGTKGRVLSARSTDGVSWHKEPGVRIDCEGAEDRTLSPDVVRTEKGWRVYFESSVDGITSIASAFSPDGLTFRRESLRLSVAGASIGSPRALADAEGAVRLYFHVYREPFEHGLGRGNHVESAIAHDGLSFERERGIRIPQTIAGLEDEAVYCARMLRVPGGGIRTFYSAWNGARRRRGAIMTATSRDGLSFEKHEVPCIAGDGELDGGFASDPTVFRAPDGRWRMVYEAADAAGRTRLLAAVARR